MFSDFGHVMKSINTQIEYSEHFLGGIYHHYIATYKCSLHSILVYIDFIALPKSLNVAIVSAIMCNFFDGLAIV